MNNLRFFGVSSTMRIFAWRDTVAPWRGIPTAFPWCFPCVQDCPDLRQNSFIRIGLAWSTQTSSAKWTSCLYRQCICIPYLAHKQKALGARRRPKGLRKGCAPSTEPWRPHPRLTLVRNSFRASCSSSPLPITRCIRKSNGYPGRGCGEGDLIRHHPHPGPLPPAEGEGP